MFKLLGKVFGSDTAMTTISKGLDAAYFTDEEKAKNHINLLQAYEAYKLAQRLLAMVVVPPYVLASVITWAAAFWIESVDNQLAVLNGQLGEAFWMVVVFYFGGGAVEGVVSKVSSVIKARKETTKD